MSGDVSSEKEAKMIRKAASFLLLKLAYNNSKIQDGICEEFGFSPVGWPLIAKGKCYSVAKVSINLMPKNLVK